MKKSLLTALALSGVVLFGHPSAFAQDSSTSAGANQGAIDQDNDLLRKDIRSQKKQLIAANLPLTDSEAQKFWPVYDQHTAELVAINNDKYQLIKESNRACPALAKRKHVSQGLPWDEMRALVSGRRGNLRLNVIEVAKGNHHEENNQMKSPDSALRLRWN